MDISDMMTVIPLTLPSLAHLTQLTELIINQNVPQGAVLQLPSSPRNLRLGKCKDLPPVLALQQLQRLRMFPEPSQQHQVLELAQVPCLEVLELNYCRTEDAAAAAPTWALLPQLKNLNLGVECSSAADRQHMVAILADTAADTQLTRLQLGTLYADLFPMQRDDQQDTMSMCGSLVGLTGLKHLEVLQLCLVMHWC
jgi:hypothetical protein